MSTQLSFSLRTSTNCKTVHLVGSWDKYQGRLPLTKDASGKAGSWNGVFRFQQTTLKPGQRYWYYYVLNNSQAAHDPAKASVQEKTTGRTLNVLDVPKSTKATATKAAATKKTTRSASPNRPLATGRGLSPSRIRCPKPSKPYASRAVREAEFNDEDVVELEGKLSQLELYQHNLASGSSVSSVTDSDLSSSSGFSTPSTVSDASSCHCNRYGITRAGKKVLLDCGGSRCGAASDSESCCSSDSESDSEDDEPLPTRARVAART